MEARSHPIEATTNRYAPAINRRNAIRLGLFGMLGAAGYGANRHFNPPVIRQERAPIPPEPLYVEETTDIANMQNGETLMNKSLRVTYVETTIPFRIDRIRESLQFTIGGFEYRILEYPLFPEIDVGACIDDIRRQDSFIRILSTAYGHADITQEELGKQFLLFNGNEIVNVDAAVAQFSPRKGTALEKAVAIARWLDGKRPGDVQAAMISFERTDNPEPFRPIA